MALLPLGKYKMKFQHLLLITSFILLSACAETNVLTKKEMETQSKADAVVAGALFDNDLNEQASYNISKKGSVTIKFTEAVKSKDYTKIVNLLRSNTSINGVYAEQSGNEVCGLP